jgi:hypothetical protein
MAVVRVPLIGMERRYLRGVASTFVELLQQLRAGA